MLAKLGYTRNNWLHFNAWFQILASEASLGQTWHKEGFRVSFHIFYIFNSHCRNRRSKLIYMLTLDLYDPTSEINYQIEQEEEGHEELPDFEFD